MIQDQLKQIIAQAVKSAFSLEVDVVVSAADQEFGDFTTNVPFQLAGKLGKSPQDISVEIVKAIKDPLIARAEAAGNGYVNLTLSNSFWLNQFNEVDRNYGHCTAGKDRKVQVEFISANPTGPTTIGNARGGFIGDVLARVLETQGFAVTREYYFNNAGTQISKLLESVKEAARLLKVADEDIQYRGEYINDLAQKFAAELETQSDEELKELLTQAILETYIKPAIVKMNIHFDIWFNENDVLKDGTFEQVLAALRDKDLIYEKDGALWLSSAKLGIKRDDRVLVKGNGDPTYLAPDIAYHANIFGQRDFDEAIKVLGADHIDQFPSVQAAVKALYPEKSLRMASHQWFRLIKDGKEVKVSKRLGQFVTIEELIDEVGADVARFLTLSRDENSHMDFDLGLAKEQSQKNPLFYVMYAYVRANSILEKASAVGISPGSRVDSLTDFETRIIKKISEYPALLADIAEDFKVHKLTFFGRELAQLFHDYYESEKVIDLPKHEAEQRLCFIEKYADFMKGYFETLGITPQEKM